MARLVLIFAGLVTGCASTLTPPQPTIYADDLPIERPRSRSPSLAVELIDKTFARPIELGLDLPRQVRRLAGAPYEAQNVDAFDEVPNSTWFTNRLGRSAMTPAQVHRGAMTPAQVHRGATTSDGPDTTGPWRVTSFKTAGVTPGMTIIDARGDRYVIKIDPPDYVGLPSGADVIGSRLLHAAGYNVPENTVAWLDVDRLVCDAGAKLQLATDDSRDAITERRLVEDDLQRRLQDLLPPGQRRLRVVASRFLPGRPIGPFAYTGTRRDDPNDVIAHENRRELRGLYVIAAWMNHADMKAENSLDIYDAEARHVVHYLLDFGASMGSNSTGPSGPRRGVANSFDLGDAFVRWASLGLRVHGYERHDRPIATTEVGYLGNDLFHPDRWKPMYPAAPFDNRTNRDLFWGVRIVTAFTDDHIQAAVQAGQFVDAASDSALVRFLVERRDRIGQYWFSRINALDGFAVQDGRLAFHDLAVERGYADERDYDVRLLSRAGTPLDEQLNDTLAIDLTDLPRDDLIIDLRPAGQDVEPVRLYLSGRDDEWRLVGLRR